MALAGTNLSGGSRNCYNISQEFPLSLIPSTVLEFPCERIHFTRKRVAPSSVALRYTYGSRPAAAHDYPSVASTTA